jgi:hypothetical protein
LLHSLKSDDNIKNLSINKGEISMQLVEYTLDGAVIYEPAEEELAVAAGGAGDLDTLQPAGEEVFLDGIIEEYDAPDPAADAPGFTHRDFKLASMRAFPEFKAGVKKHCVKTPFGKQCFNRPALWQRHSEVTLYARVAVRNITAAHVWDEIRGCVIGAAAAAGGTAAVSAYLSGGAATLSSFLATMKPLLVACLTSKGEMYVKLAKDIRVNTHVTKKTGHWFEVK